MTRRDVLAFLLALGLFRRTVRADPKPYQGVDMPTPAMWEVFRVDNKSFAFVRGFKGPGGAQVIMRARPATEAECEAMRKPDRGDLPATDLPDWERSVEKVDGGYAVIYERDGRARAKAFLCVIDKNGKSFVTFEGYWPSKVKWLVALAADTVLTEIHNR